MKNISSRSVDFILTDPPYAVRYRDRSGRTMLNDDNDAWLAPAFAEMYRVLKPDAFCVSFYGWDAADRFIAAWRRAGFKIAGHIVFRKQYASSTGLLERRHEQAYLLMIGAGNITGQPVPDVLEWKVHRQSSAPYPEARVCSEAFDPKLQSAWRCGPRSVLWVRLNARRSPTSGAPLSWH